MRAAVPARVLLAGPARAGRRDRPRRLGADLGPESRLGHRARRASRTEKPGARAGARAGGPDPRSRSTAGADARRSDRRGRASGLGRHPRRAASTRSTGSSRTASAERSAFELELAPFLGVMGMPPPEPGVHRPGRLAAGAATWTARSWLRARRSISRFRSRALSSPPATAMPCRATARSPGPRSRRRRRAQLTLDLADEPVLEWPRRAIDGAWITFGFDEDLVAAAGSRSKACSR